MLALVLETEGSTYAGTGAMALFGHGTHAGWLSGGCLEPEIARCAEEAGATGMAGWLEIDTRDDELLLTGSAVGCRGRLRIALLPLQELPGIDAILEAWLEGQQHASFNITADGGVEAATPTLRRRWQLAAMPVAWSSPRQRWRVSILRPPEVLILGAGPETPVLVPLLRELGWRVHVAERRPRWRDHPALDGVVIDAPPAQSLSRAAHADAALVMHHNFELDREALDALATSAIPFIGLLGPSRRQEDLFRLLTPAQRSALQPRLRSPVGIDLGGRGPETIALSIAAQLQAWRHSADA
ncbi:XshC-Cox1-family protein [Lysobacter sp. Root494]|nr:XshC-Cox1-family protein [Lysobacter sp. Root494]